MKAFFLVSVFVPAVAGTRGRDSVGAVASMALKRRGGGEVGGGGVVRKATGSDGEENEIASL